MRNVIPADRIEQWRRFARRNSIPLFAVSMFALMTLILSINVDDPNRLSVSVGQPAPNDIFAPRALTYTSEILTEDAREQAGQSVDEVYTPLDLSIGRNQLAYARSVFAFFETVRADAAAPLDTRLEYLQSVEGITISQELARTILELSQSDYERARADVLSIVQELMREEIRPIQLGDYQRAAQRLVSLDLSQAQTSVVTELAYQFIVPTVFPDDAATQQAREAARVAIAPVTRSVAADQRIIRAGDLVNDADYELLTELGLLRQQRSWTVTLSTAMLSLLIVAVVTIYWTRFQRRRFPNTRYLVVLALLLLLFTVGARVMTQTDSLAYWYPLAALTMLLAVVYDIRFSILVTMLMAGMVGVIQPNSLQLTIYMAAGGILSALTIRDPQRVTAIFRAGLIAAAGYLFVSLMFWLSQQTELTVPPASLAVGLGNGILSSGLTLALFYIVGGVFGIVTMLQLQDLSRLDHPLLRDLLRRAPGTYHHSIMVANLAEQAAERIGANSTLVRVGAFYHDIGKMNRPPFFTENQEGIDPHESLDPVTSARIIMSHVKDGLDMAKRHRLPFRIEQIIAEHHGTRTIKSFYRKAQERAGDDSVEIDVRPFQYQGPRPTSKESGIVMLADAIDATSTAVRPNTERAIVKLVGSIIEDDMLDGQLDNSGLTLGDLEMLKQSFIETLKGRFHVRVQYPGNEELLDQPPAPTEPAAAQEPAARSRLFSSR